MASSEIPSPNASSRNENFPTDYIQSPHQRVPNETMRVIKSAKNATPRCCSPVVGRGCGRRIYDCEGPPPGSYGVLSVPKFSPHEVVRWHLLGGRYASIQNAQMQGGGSFLVSEIPNMSLGPVSNGDGRDGHRGAPQRLLPCPARQRLHRHAQTIKWASESGGVQTTGGGGVAVLVVGPPFLKFSPSIFFPRVSLHFYLHFFIFFMFFDAQSNQQQIVKVIRSSFCTSTHRLRPFQAIFLHDAYLRLKTPLFYKLFWW